MTRLLVGMPAYDGVKAQTVSSLLALTAELRQREIACDVSILPGLSLLEYARAVLVARFLGDVSATHMLFVDADMEFAPDVVVRMLAADVDVIGVSAPTRSLDLDKVREAVLAGRSDWRTAGLKVTTEVGDCAVDIVRGAVAVPCGVGTGLMLVKRHVLERVRAAHLELMFSNFAADGFGEPLCLMFRSGIREGILYGEDQGFCQLWRELGGVVHVLIDADIGHHGNYCYRANLDDLYNPTPRVAANGVPPCDERAATTEGLATEEWAGILERVKALARTRALDERATLVRELRDAKENVEMFVTLERIAAMGDV